MKPPGKPAQPQSTAPSENWPEIVRQQVDKLESGLVEIIVHNSQVVQIETTERVNLEDKTLPAPSPVTDK